MLDTNVINYGASKLDSLYNCTSPLLAGLTEDYIRDAVSSQALSSVMGLIILAVLCTALVTSFIIYKKKYNAREKPNNIYFSEDSDKFYFYINVSVLVVLIFIGVIIVAVDIHQTIMALKFPEAFALDKLLNK